MTQTYAERTDLVERISELETFIKTDREELAKLTVELRMYDYTKRFNEVTAGEVPWDRFCWPSYSNGGYPDCYVCIVCKKGFKRFHGNSYSGAYIGGGIGQPNMHVHERCMPKRILNDIKNDIW